MVKVRPVRDRNNNWLCQWIHKKGCEVTSCREVRRRTSHSALLWVHCSPITYLPILRLTFQGVENPNMGGNSKRFPMEIQEALTIPNLCKFSYRLRWVTNAWNDSRLIRESYDCRLTINHAKHIIQERCGIPFPWTLYPKPTRIKISIWRKLRKSGVIRGNRTTTETLIVGIWRRA